MEQRNTSKKLITETRFYILILLILLIVPFNGIFKDKGWGTFTVNTIEIPVTLKSTQCEKIHGIDGKEYYKTVFRVGGTDIVCHIDREVKKGEIWEGRAKIVYCEEFYESMLENGAVSIEDVVLNYENGYSIYSVKFQYSDWMQTKLSYERAYNDLVYVNRDRIPDGVSKIETVADETGEENGK